MWFWLQDLYGVFSLRTYDSLNPADKGFLKDYERFNDKVTSLDRLATTYCCVFNRFSTHTTQRYILYRKLGAILGRAFEDCIVSESLFKLLYIFGILLWSSILFGLQSVTESPRTRITLQNRRFQSAVTFFLSRILTCGFRHLRYITKKKLCTNFYSCTIIRTPRKW